MRSGSGVLAEFLQIKDITGGGVKFRWAGGGARWQISRELSPRDLASVKGFCSVGISLKRTGRIRCQNVLNIAQGLKFKADFYSKMTVCRHELGGSTPQTIPTLYTMTAIRYLWHARRKCKVQDTSMIEHWTVLRDTVGRPETALCYRPFIRLSVGQSHGWIVENGWR